MKSICLNRFRALLALAVLLGFSANADLSFIFTNAAPKAIPRRASIIFIQVDGLGYGDLSCYGQTNFQTPDLDKLAADGIRFTNYFIASDAVQSHAALMLGKNPGHLRQRADADIPLAPDEITVAQVLKNAGYHTGVIGDWDLGDENSSGAPWKKGFDEFAGYLNPNDAENFYADYVFRCSPHSIYDATNQQFDTYIGREPLIANDDGAKSTYIPDVLAKAALNFVKDNLPDQFNHYQPFFLLLNYEIPDRYIELPTDAPFSEEPWSQPEKNRAALIARIDSSVGELRAKLKDIGMTNNVVIFFSSGGFPGEAAKPVTTFFHSNLSPGDLRAPMIACWPETIPAGQVSGYKWSAWDFLPTAADIGFTKTPANIDGTSVLPVMTGGKEP